MQATLPLPTKKILGVRFFTGSVAQAVDVMIAHGGLLVVPAAPALVNIQYDPEYRRAVTGADLAIGDSGFMVLLWQLLKREKIPRISGLVYLKECFRHSEFRSSDSAFFVLPSASAQEKALAWFRVNQINISIEDTYVAPRYSAGVTDENLLNLVERKRPSQIVIALGGGVQEKLGLFLREALPYRPSIHCIGAALGFLTGDQKPIPMWADRLYLGWALRLGRNPRLYFRRFWVAHELPGLILRNGNNVPPLRSVTS